MFTQTKNRRFIEIPNTRSWIHINQYLRELKTNVPSDNLNFLNNSLNEYSKNCAVCIFSISKFFNIVSDIIQNETRFLKCSHIYCHSPQMEFSLTHLLWIRNCNETRITKKKRFVFRSFSRGISFTYLWSLQKETVCGYASLENLIKIRLFCLLLGYLKKYS